MIVLVLLLSLCLGATQAQSDPCVAHSTSCKECVLSSSCLWCSSENYPRNERCMSIGRINECPKTDLQNPKGSVEYSINRDFSSETQIKPQRLKIKLRPTETQKFQFQFKAAKDYPADLYFLFDSSGTMTNVISSAADASERIYLKMKEKTANVLLGMGTFNDKNAAPIVRNKLLKISSFSHKLPLTTNFNLLKESVHNVSKNMVGNIDGPEGGFDALAQVITCKKEIGWRDDSRKFIFFFTDATSHIAGDAKVAGIVQPYDGECYTENGTYTKELELDYPSASIIDELAVREGVTIVFIVKSDLRFYEIVNKKIRGSILIELKENTVNLEDVIVKAYENTTQAIKLDLVMASEDYEKINVTFNPDCKNEGCNVTVNPTEPYNIEGDITLSKYYGKDHINVDVTIQNIRERLSLDIELIDCNCTVEINSTYCSYHGTKKCGNCDCNAGWTGTQCKCEMDEANCKQPGIKDGIYCNGRGDCKCGSCDCHQGYSGTYCECENSRCGMNCNGHGSCHCGKCYCDKGWTGEYCDCEKKACKKVNGKVCNGRGVCTECGQCNCDAPAKWDARESQNYETCEMKCADCHDNQCLKLKECAICRQSYDENSCSSSCGDIQVKVVDSLNDATDEHISICKNIQAGAGCYTHLHYQYDDENYRIRMFIQSEMHCLPSYYMWGGGVLIALLVVGLGTLIGWKLLTDYRDRREYQNFLKTHGSGEGCSNPIYENPTTTIRNPAFRKPSVDYTLH